MAASVQPLIKKSSPYPSKDSNYTQISKLLLLLSSLRRLFTHNSLKNWDKTTFMKNFSWGFRQHYSTRTVHIRITNYLLGIADTGDSSIFALVDSSAAFDTVQHKTLMERPRHALRYLGQLWGGFELYIFCGDCVPPHSLVNFGVPQG